MIYKAAAVLRSISTLPLEWWWCVAMRIKVRLFVVMITMIQQTVAQNETHKNRCDADIFYSDSMMFKSQNMRHFCCFSMLLNDKTDFLMHFASCMAIMIGFEKSAFIWMCHCDDCETNRWNTKQYDVVVSIFETFPFKITAWISSDSFTLNFHLLRKRSKWHFNSIYPHKWTLFPFILYVWLFVWMVHELLWHCNSPTQLRF